ncbi:hypothetical protein FB45DRAFT_1141352, partial [Roridomyces roridus]
RSLPRAIQSDVKNIRGNISEEEKQIWVNIFAFLTTSGKEPYCRDIGSRLEFSEANVWEKERKEPAAEAIWEIQVTEEMCNVYGKMHDGCAAYIVDLTTIAASVLLGRTKGFDGSGVSQNMNIHWHHPAPLCVNSD